MKVVILAGGFGTRIGEETKLIPKPMVTIGEKPILWHIMKYYSHFGFNEFIICGGYKQNIIKEYFNQYYDSNCDITYSYVDGFVKKYNDCHNEKWNITVVDTGLNTMTGGRLKRIQKYIDTDNFLMTYGDGLSDIDITKLVEFHLSNRKIATISAVQPFGRFGVLEFFETNRVKRFKEKDQNDMGWINAGFMVLNTKIFDYIEDDSIVFEKYPLEKIASEQELIAYKHHGFWQCMDTLKDKTTLESYWNDSNCPWKLW